MLVEADMQLRAGNYEEAEQLLIAVDSRLDEAGQGTSIAIPQ
jgi:hypothetical protein